MRYIPIELLEVPDGWLSHSTTALEAVKKLKDEKPKVRNAEIQAHAKVTWRAMKNSLMNLSDEKCWYCEVRQDRSLGAVDHFRPKGRVDGLPSHPGYWWLAFDQRNFRFACTLCNSATTDRKSNTVGGKRDLFPIFDEAKRATSPSSNCADELPKLLDPTEILDPTLLTFTVDGNPAARYTKAQNAEWNERADLSIEVYHLRHHKLRKRRTAIYNELRMLIKEGDILYGHAVTDQHFEKTSIERVTRRIMEMLNVRAELSAAARQYTTEFLTGSPKRIWLEGIVNAA